MSNAGVVMQPLNEPAEEEIAHRPASDEKPLRVSGSRRESSRREMHVRTAHADLTFRESLQVFVVSIYVQGIVALLVLLDIVVLLLDEPWNDQPSENWIKIATWIIIIIFMLEIILRIVAFGLLFLWRNWGLDLFDAIVIGGSLVALLLEETVFAKGLMVARILRVVRFFRSLFFFYKASQNLQGAARRVTGENKMRYVDVENGFDLDLTYITDSLIAMSVPATGWVQAFRNPIGEVARFFRTFHEDHFRIYNCCPEHPYPFEPFAGNVRPFDIQDHTPPNMGFLIEFMEDARTFVDKAPEDNVIAVHCRGGKGRTGTLCCTWLLYTQEPGCEVAEDCLSFFAASRSDLRFSDKLQGVDTPSQKRYVMAIDMLLAKNNCYIHTPPQNIKRPPLAPITLTNLNVLDFFSHPQEIASKCPIQVVVQECDVTTWTIKLETPALSGTDVSNGNINFDLKGTQVQGDVRVTVYDYDKRLKAGPVKKGVIAGNEPGVLFYFIFHSAFLDFQNHKLLVPTDMMDKAFKDHKGKYNAGGVTSMSFTGTDPWCVPEPEPEPEPIELQIDMGPMPASDVIGIVQVPAEDRGCATQVLDSLGCGQPAQ